MMAGASAGGSSIQVVYGSVACLYYDDETSEHAAVFAIDATDGRLVWLFKAPKPTQTFAYAIVRASSTLVVQACDGACDMMVLTD